MDTLSPDSILEALRWRYAVKEFDPEKKIPEETIKALKEALVLTPSSFGLQPWKFYFVADQSVKEQMPAISWDQQQPKDCSHMVVLAIKKDFSLEDVASFIDRMAQVRGVTVESLEGYKSFAGGFVQKAAVEGWIDDWAAKQVYIALGQLMMSAAVWGVDACPMEGISPDEYDRLLGIDADGYHTVLGCPLGYRAEGDKYATTPKVRFEDSVVIEDV